MLKFMCLLCSIACSFVLYAQGEVAFPVDVSNSTLPILDLSNSKLLAEVDGSEATITTRTTLDQSVFETTVTFVATSFQCPVYANFAAFGSDVDFEAAKFDSGAYFLGTHFNAAAFFNAAQFRANTDFSWATFHDRTDFDGAAFGDVTFRESTFLASADFEEAQFKQAAVFNNSKFLAPLNFHGVDFAGATYFDSSLFNGIVYFSGSNFTSEASFIETDFHSTAIFSETQFDFIADFYWTTFQSDALFNWVKFGAHAYFTGVEFDTVVDFVGATFNADALFNGTVFGNRADFTWASFGAVADFNGAVLNGVTLGHTILPEYLSFEGVTTKGLIDLTTTQLDSAATVCYINLIDAPIEHFKLRYDKFRVYRPDSITVDGYEKLTNVYEGLLKKFEDYGYLTSYEILDKEYQEFKYTQTPERSKVIGYTLNFLNKHWSDYGYGKARIWLYTFGFFLFFFLINWWFFPKLVEQVYPIPPINKALLENERLADFHHRKGRYPHFSFRTFSLVIYYTGIVFFGFKMNLEEMNFRKPGWLLLLFLEYLIGLICVAYLANFVITAELIGG